jgi:hypothetical protein
MDLSVRREKALQRGHVFDGRHENGPPRGERRLARLLALLLTGLPLALVAFAPPAWAASAPTPSAGPPFVPYFGPRSVPLAILLPGALASFAAIAVTLVILARGRRRRSGTSAAAFPSGGRTTLEQPFARSEGSETALPEPGQDRRKTQRRAA